MMSKIVKPFKHFSEALSLGMRVFRIRWRQPYNWYVSDSDGEPVSMEVMYLREMDRLKRCKPLRMDEDEYAFFLRDHLFRMSDQMEHLGSCIRLGRNVPAFLSVRSLMLYAVDGILIFDRILQNRSFDKEKEHTYWCKVADEMTAIYREKTRPTAIASTNRSPMTGCWWRKSVSETR